MGEKNVDSGGSAKIIQMLSARTLLIMAVKWYFCLW